VQGEITCGGLVPWSGQDLRILLRLSPHDPLGQLRDRHPDKARFDSLTSAYVAQRTSAEIAGVPWRAKFWTTFTPRAIDDMMTCLVEVWRASLPEHILEDYEELSDVAELFYRAEWTGVEVDPIGAPQMLATHIVGTAIYPQVDVVPRAATGRMGVRGGFNVMAWPKHLRHHLVAPSGRLIASFDVNAMDVRSLLALAFPDGGSPIPMGRGVDLYQEIISFCRPGRELTDEMRAVVKDTFVPIVYGMSDEALREKYGESGPMLRELYSPLLSRFPKLGREVALLGQTASSRAFRGGLRALARCGRRDFFALFPVHDELVLSVDARSVDTLRDLASTMEHGAMSVTGVEYSVRIKVGPNYGKMEVL
jgi:hypothetical protein